MGRNFKINGWKFDIYVLESKLMPYARKNLKVEASLSGNLITSVCTDVRKKTKNSIQCLKIMVIVQISSFHARMEWKKIDSVSDTWQCTPLTSRRISEEVSERCLVSGWICGWNESRIWFSMWNFLYREITTKHVSCENLVNFWICYLYIKLFLAHIENHYI